MSEYAAKSHDTHMTEPEQSSATASAESGPSHRRGHTKNREGAAKRPLRATIQAQVAVRFTAIL